MTWARRFRLRESLRESLWLIPIAGAALGGILGVAVSVADEQIGTPSLWQYSPSTASTVLTAIIGAAAALTGFVVTVTVLVVQMATGTFSARIMRLWFRDRILKVTLAILVGTLTYSFSVLQRIDDDFVPDIGVTLSGALISLSLLVFIVFFDRFIRRLRPVAVAADVADVPARRSRRSCASLIARTSGGSTSRPARSRRWSCEPAAAARSRPSILTVSSSGLARIAPSSSCLDGSAASCIRAGIWSASTGASSAIVRKQLEGMIALGEERSFDQDPSFAIRMMVDIANKALSPAVNDPTDRRPGSRPHRRSARPDRANRLREAQTAGKRRPAGRGRDGDSPLGGVRDAGADGDPGVRCDVCADHATPASAARGPAQTVRVEHRAALEEELRRLDAGVAESWRDSVDLDRAAVADRQGIGDPAPASII